MITAPGRETGRTVDSPGGPEGMPGGVVPVVDMIEIGGVAAGMGGLPGGGGGRAPGGRLGGSPGGTVKLDGEMTELLEAGVDRG